MGIDINVELATGDMAGDKAGDTEVNKSDLALNN